MENQVFSLIIEQIFIKHLLDSRHRVRQFNRPNKSAIFVFLVSFLQSCPYAHTALNSQLL